MYLIKKLQIFANFMNNGQTLFADTQFVFADLKEIRKYSLERFLFITFP